MNEKLIYVVDDEQNIRDLIREYLINSGYRVETFDNGEDVLEAFKRNPADMLILDIMMPEMDGLTVCKEVRKICNVPIIMVSAKDDEIDKIIGLEIGGDDYIAKPFSPRELVSRVKSVFRRVDEKASTPLEKNKLKIADISIFLDERKVVSNLTEIEFTSKEYSLFLFLCENKNKVFNREQLISSIWGYEFIGDTRAVDDLVKRIRKKLTEAASEIEIKTVWGYGYKIVDNE
ncbi:MAG: response regulator transcription factor [Clostridia bacterium]